MDILPTEDVIKIVGMVIGGGAVLMIGFYYVLRQWSRRAYTSYMNDPQTHCDIDNFVTTSEYNTNPPNTFKVALAHKVQVRGWKGRTARTAPIAIECTKSPHVHGLFVVREVNPDRTTSKTDQDEDEETFPIQDVLDGKISADGGSNTTTGTTTKKPVMVIATIRMGFGHHRIAYSAASWSLQQNYTTIFHDFLNIDSDESNLIKTLDTFYSKCSRIASDFGGPVERLLGQVTKQGDADGLRIACLTANQLMPLLSMYDKETTPIICTHQVCALVASALGFKTVINFVVDNYPQWFLVVPNTLNVCQGPINYQTYLKMGVPLSQLKLMGHWCPSELVTNIEHDCTQRITRASHTGTQYKPRRLLIPVGGAGAQRRHILELIKALHEANYLRDGKIQLFLNAGDHKHMKVAFEEILEECKLDYDTVSTTQGVREFQDRLVSNPSMEPIKAITLFAFKDYFPAVATTDLLCRCSDLLTCKPSELAFYPIPKLHVRRVGDHEAYSAIRAAEINDGSLEARTIEDTLRYLELLCDPSQCDLLQMWNTAIITNHTKLQMYNGCKNSIEWAAAKIAAK